MSEPCIHVRNLLRYLSENSIKIWGEGTEDPTGWVNVACKQCGTSYEMYLGELGEETKVNPLKEWSDWFTQKGDGKDA